MEGLTVTVDWSREQTTRRWHPSTSLLQTIRRYQLLRERSGSLAQIRSKWNVLLYHFWTVVTGADIPLMTKIGGGLLLPHPNGIVIHPDVVVGANCLIFQQVTLGMGSLPGVPTIGNHVDIGAGAKILGGVMVGDGARIGANSVVLSDIPPGATAVGSPARVLSKKSAT
jgi:serine O-acetyltransferase